MNPAKLFRREDDAVSLPSGETLFHEGEAGMEMFVLLEGTVDIVVGTRVIETLGAGELLGEMALIDNSPRTASVVAKTDCRLAKINVKRFHFLVQQTPFFATHVMKVMAERIRRMNRLLVQT